MRLAPATPIGARTESELGAERPIEVRQISKATIELLNALSDTFTSARYIRDGNPLVVDGGGLVGAVVLFGIVGIVAFVRSRRIKHGAPV